MPFPISGSRQVLEGVEGRKAYFVGLFLPISIGSVCLSSVMNLDVLFRKRLNRD